MAHKIPASVKVALAAAVAIPAAMYGYNIVSLPEMTLQKREGSVTEVSYRTNPNMPPITQPEKLAVRRFSTNTANEKIILRPADGGEATTLTRKFVTSSWSLGGCAEFDVERGGKTKIQTLCVSAYPSGI